MKLLIVLALTSLCFVKIEANAVCSSGDDPHLVSFDGRPFEFQYQGDHFIMYDDFKNTRVTADYFTCVPNIATCNCAVHIKHGRKLAFVDFCGVTDPSLPVSQPYFVETSKGKTGLKAISEMPECDIIAADDELNEARWATLKPIANSFKCARMQGSNFYTTYIIRTLEPRFEDGIEVKLMLGTLTMPSINIKIGQNNFNSTGGICGRWDNNQSDDFFVLDEYGQEDFSADVATMSSFWKLNSRYNKPELNKRCPECYTLSERSYYCPCDEFDLFHAKNNYQLESDAIRPRYCETPWGNCAQRFWDLNETEIIFPDPPGTNNGTEIDTKPCREQCEEVFLNHTQLAQLIEQNCSDINSVLDKCALDVCTGPNIADNFIQMHLQTVLDEALQNFLATGNEACNTGPACADNCNGHGTCIFDNACYKPPTKAIGISPNCLSPVKCECDTEWVGKTCDISKNDIASLQLIETCCDLRSGTCDLHRARGFPLATNVPIYVQIQYIERLVGGDNVIAEYLDFYALSANSLSFKLGKLDQLTLYKNIHGQATNSVLRESSSTVKISISYVPFPQKSAVARRNEPGLVLESGALTTESADDDHNSQSAILTLYDSKCKTCQAGMAGDLQNTCEINGVCYVDRETVDNDNTQVCDPDFGRDTSVTLPESGQFCDKSTHNWSAWINEDEPSGDGDLELIGLHGNPACYLHQFLTVGGVKYNDTNERVHFDSCYGFMCLNKENNGTCSDYHYKQCCPREDISTPASTQSPSTTQAPATTTIEPNTSDAIATTSTSTEELITSTIGELTTTTTEEPCSFVINAGNGAQQPLTVEEGKQFSFDLASVKLDWSTPTCESEGVSEWRVNTKGYSATKAIDFSDVVTMNGQTITIETVEDEFKEPFEFFSFEATTCYRENCQSFTQIVYIEDNDNSVNGTVNKAGIYDIFNYEEASRSINPSFYSYEGGILPIDSELAKKESLYPDQGGFSSPYNRLKIIFQYIWPLYEVHTIEINNREQCNIQQMSARRLEGTNINDLESLDQFLMDSFYLNGRAVIDIDYYRAFNGSPSVDGVEYLELNWLSTRDGNNPGPCEVRVFGKKVKELSKKLDA